MSKNLLSPALALLLFCFAFSSCQKADNDHANGNNQNNDNRESNREPNVYYVTDFGAKADTSFLSTAAIQKALDAATEAGGGKVVVTPGTYKIGTIVLKSNTTLEIMSGATLLGSPNLDDYIEMEWGHNKDRQPYHLITARDAENVEISGGGIIDGNGPAFWLDYDPANDPQWVKAKDLKVSPMAEIKNCKNVRIKDVEMRTGGGWTLHLYDSDHVQVQGVRILNNVFAPNGDGIDITGCFDVTISDCIIKTCDDAICLKTTVDSRECKRVVVSNNVIECLCAALKIGNETFRDISQVTFSNNIVYNSSRAFAIYAESAGTIEDITVNNLICDTKAPLIYNRPIHLSLYLPEPGAGGRNGDWMHKEQKQWDYEGREPRLRNISISNVISKTEGRILIAAEEGRYIENLTLRDITMTYPFIEDPRPNVEKAKSSQFSPMNPDAKVARAALVAENVKNMVVDNMTINWPLTNTIPRDWQHKKRIANGTFDEFELNYSAARQTEFSAIWGRGLVGGYINTPESKASDKSMPRFDIKNSSIAVK